MKLRGTCKNCKGPVFLESSGRWMHDDGFMAHIFCCAWPRSADPLLLEVP